VAAATGQFLRQWGQCQKADEEAVTQAMIGVFQAADLQRAPAEFDMAQIQQILAQSPVTAECRCGDDLSVHDVRAGPSTH